MSVFKANDIRGIYGSELTEALAYRVGKAAALYLKSKEIIVGRDDRLSSPSLSEALIQGIRDSGVGVLDLGLVDTPCLYFATGYLKLPGIMVTASHNPPEHNGFYICRKNAEPIGMMNGLADIEKLAWKNSTLGIKKHIGPVRPLSVQKEYIKHVLSFVQPKALALKVVVDPGNGMGAWSVPLVYPETALTYSIINKELDGSYPHRGPNSADPKNLVALGKQVVKQRARLGIAFDGDADRAAFVDEHGVMVEGSIAGALIARYLLKKERGKIVHSSTCSHSFTDAVRSAGGIPVKDRVGHTMIGIRMRKEKALFGAENTGHYFYRDNFFADSGIISSLIMCQIIVESKRAFSDLVLQFTRYYRVPEVSFRLKHTEGLLAKLRKIYSAERPVKIDEIDGLTVEFPDYWFNVRMSQTEEGFTRITLEAHTEEGAQAYLNKLSRIVKKLGSA